MLASNSKYSKFWKVIEGTENHSKNHNYNHLDKWLKNTKGQWVGQLAYSALPSIFEVEIGLVLKKKLNNGGVAFTCSKM